MSTIFKLPELLESGRFRHPRCTCHSFRQIYICGCPDVRQQNGLPALTFQPCEFHYYPVTLQELAILEGYRCRRIHNPKIVILPFPCARHNEEATVRLTARELRLAYRCHPGRRPAAKKHPGREE